jgi:hypothetical protein
MKKMYTNRLLECGKINGLTQAMTQAMAPIAKQIRAGRLERLAE